MTPRLLIIFCLFFGLCLAKGIYGEPTHPLAEDPLTELEDLIQSTEKLLAKQKTLYQELASYLTLRAEAVNDLDNKELVLKTAKAAKNALDIIKEEHLSHLFTNPFLSEMTLFAKLAGRPRIPQ
jgi:hypothetical protein